MNSVQVMECLACHREYLEGKREDDSDVEDIAKALTFAIKMIDDGITEHVKKTLKHHDLVERLEKRAEIRRNIQDRKSVQEGKPDRIADLLEEAAQAIREMKGS